MSVEQRELERNETPADANLNETRENLVAAIEALSSVVVRQCRGHDSYIKEYREKMPRCLNLMMHARSLLFTTAAVKPGGEDGPGRLPREVV